MTFGSTIGCVFDPAGDLTTTSPQGGTQTILSYDAANRLQTAVTGANTCYFSWDTTHGWRTSQGPMNNPQDPRVRYTFTGTGRLATCTNELSNPTVSATYAYDAQGQRTQSAVTMGAQTTTSNFVYEGLNLMGLSASQTGGTSNDSWKLTYLYDENGRPYGGIYRDPATSTTPTATTPGAARRERVM